MASRNQWNDVPRIEPYVQPVNGIVQPAVIPPPNRPGRRTNVLDTLKQVVTAISRKRWAIYFRKPVDSFALGVPQYHEVVRQPMDLGTIKKRLENHYYCQAAEAIEDITLIIENCLMFNMEGTVVHQAGEEMKVLFHNLLAKIDLTNEVEVMPKPKPGKRKKASEEKPPSGLSYPAVDPPQSQSRPNVPSLKPPADSVPNKVEVEVKPNLVKSKRSSEENRSSGLKDLAVDPHQSQSKPKLPSLKPAAYLPNEMKVKVEEKAKPKPNSKPSQNPSGREGFAPDPHQSQFNSFCVGVTSEPDLPILNPVPNEMEVKVKAKRGKGKKASEEKPPSGHKDLAADPVQSQSQPQLPSLKPADPVPHEIEGEVKPKFGKRKIPADDNPSSGPKDLAADPHQSQSKPKLPSLKPAAYLPNEMKVEVEEKAKPKPNSKPSQNHSGREGFAADPHQSQFNSFCVGVTSEPNLPILNPTPNEMEVKVKTKRGKRKKASEEKPPSGHKDLAADPLQSQSQPQLPSLKPTVSVPNEGKVEVEVKTKLGKRPRASEENPSSGFEDLAVDPHQSQSKPKLRLLAMIDLTNEEEVMPNPKPSKRKKASEEKPPSGYNYLGADPQKSKSKTFCPDVTFNPKLPSPMPASSVSNEINVEIKKKLKAHQSQSKPKLPSPKQADPLPHEIEAEVKLGKRKKASEKKSSSGSKPSADTHQSRSKRCCHGATSEPKFPSLQATVSMPNDIKVEVEKKAKPKPNNKPSKSPSGREGLAPEPHQSQSRPNLPSLMPPASVPIKINEEVEEKAKPNPKPSKSLSGREDLAPEPQQFQSKSFWPDVTSKLELCSLNPAASVPNEMEVKVEVKAKRGKSKKASKDKPPSRHKDLAADPHQSQSESICLDVALETKLPIPEPAASVPNEMEVEVRVKGKAKRAKRGKSKKASEEQSPTGHKDLDADLHQCRSKSFFSGVTLGPKLPIPEPAASVGNEMEVEVKPKPKSGKRKKGPEENPFSGLKDLAVDTHQSQSKPKLQLLAMIDLTNEEEEMPKSKPSKRKKASVEKPPSGYNYLAADPQQSKSKSFCPDVAYNPKLPSLMPAASVSNQMKVEMKKKAKSPSRQKDLAAVTQKPHSKSQLPILEPAASVPNEMKMEVKTKRGKFKTASEEKPSLGHRNLAADPFQSQSKSFCPDVTSKYKLPAAFVPINIKEEVEEKTMPNPHLSQFKFNLPSLMPAASVPIKIKEKVEERAKPKTYQPQPKPNLPSLMPPASVPIKIKEEVEVKAKPNPKSSKSLSGRETFAPETHHSQSKPQLSILEPAASVPNDMEIEVKAKRGKRKKASKEKTTSGHGNLATDPFQSQSKSFCHDVTSKPNLPSLMLAGFVPIKIKEEADVQAKPNPKPSKAPSGREGLAPEPIQSQSKPYLSSLMPNASVPIKIKEEVEERANPKPHQFQSKPNLPSLMPAVSVPIKIKEKVEERAKPKTYQPQPKPNLPSLMPPASVPIKIKEEVEVKAKPNPKSSKSLSGRETFAPETHHSQSKPQLSILEPAASVPNDMEIEVKAKRDKRKKASKEKTPSGHGNLAADPLQSQSNSFCPDVTSHSSLASMMLAGFVPIKIKEEVEENVKLKPQQSQSKPNLPSQMPAASVPIKIKEKVEEKAKPKPNPMPGESPSGRKNLAADPNQSQCRPNLPRLMSTASVPIKIKEEVEENAKPNPKSSKSLSGRETLAPEPIQSQSKPNPNLPSLMPPASVPITIKEEVEERANPKPHQFQSKPNHPSLMPAVSVPIKIKEKVEDKAKPKPHQPQSKPNLLILEPPASVPNEMVTEVKGKRGKRKKASEEKPPSGHRNLAADPLQSQSKSFCPDVTSKPKLPSLMPASFVPVKIQEEVEDKANPKPHQPQSKPNLQSLMPPASVPIKIKVEVREKAKPNPKPSKSLSSREGLASETHQPQSKSNLPILEPAASVPSEMEMEVKAKRGKRKKASKEKPPSGHRNLYADPLQTQSASFCPDVTSKPNLPSLMLAGYVPIKIKEEADVKAKPNPKPSKTPSGREGLAPEPIQSQSKPNLPNLMPAGFVPIKIKEEVDEKANPKPHQPQSKSNLPRLMPPASVPIKIKVEVEEKAKPNPKPGESPSGQKDLAVDPHQSQSKPILEPAASVPNEMELKVKANLGKRKKASEKKPLSGRKGLDADSHDSRSKRLCPGLAPKPKLPSLKPAASMPNDMEVDEKVKTKPDKKASEENPPLGHKDLAKKPHQSRSKRCHVEPSKAKLPSLKPPDASVPNETNEEVEKKAKNNPNPKPSKTPSGREGLAPDAHQSKSEPNLSSLMPAASVPNEVVEAKPKRKPKLMPKPGKRKKVSGEKPSSDKAATLLQSWLKRFCPGVLPSKEPFASVPKAMVDPTMPPPPPLRWSLRRRFKQTKRMIERSHCIKLLGAMRKMEFHRITWIFNSTNYWINYSQNKDYYYKAEQKLDWPTLAHHVRLSHFKSLDSFVALVQQMFKNGLRCFPEKGVIRSNIKKTIFVFHYNLHRHKKMMKKEKDFARAIWTYQFWKPEIAAAKALKSTKPGVIVKHEPGPTKLQRLLKLLNPRRRPLKRLNLTRSSRMGKRKKTYEKKPPPGLEQSQSEGSCPGVTCEPKLPILKPSASVPNEMKVEVEKKAKPYPKRGKSASSHKDLAADPHPSQSKPKLPSLMPAASVPIRIKEKVEEKAKTKPHQSQSKPNLPILEPVASVPIKIKEKVEERAKFKPNPKRSKSSSGHKDLAADPHQSQSKPKLPILESAASVSNEMVTEVKAKRGKRKKASEEKPPSGHRNLAADPHQSQSNSFCPDVTSKPKLPSLMPSASVLNEIKVKVEVEEKASPNLPKSQYKPNLHSLMPTASVPIRIKEEMEENAKPNLKPSKSLSGREGLAPEPHESQSKPKLSILEPAAFVSNEMVMEVKSKRGKRKKASKEKPPLGHKDLAAGPLQSHSKSFYPDVISKPNLSSLMPAASVPIKIKEKVEEKAKPKPNPKPSKSLSGRETLAPEQHQSQPKLKPF